VLLANHRWERRFVKFLELSGVGRVMADGMDGDGARAARMDEGCDGPREARDDLSSFPLYHPLSGGLVSRDLRTVHRRGHRISFV
jgi:hypothetical protein